MSGCRTEGIVGGENGEGSGFRACLLLLMDEKRGGG